MDCRQKALGLLSFFCVLMGCSRPIIRSETPETPPPSIDSAPADPKFDAADLKKRLWVLPFLENSTPAPALANLNVGELMQPKIVEIFSTPKSPYLVPEQEQSSLKELNVDSSLPPVEVAKIARGSGVAGFLRGEISTLDIKEVLSSEGMLKNKTVTLKVGVTYELYDTVTARKIISGTEIQNYTETRSDLFGAEISLPEIDRKIEDLSLKLAERLLIKTGGVSEKMGWEGRVLRADSSRVYINAGRRTGIQIGDTLKVVDPSKDILDPQSGVMVGQAPGRMKGTLKVIQHFGLDGSVAVIQSGGGVRQGDRVELY